MMGLIRILYIALIGFVFYNMIKRGGCCGGHGHNHEDRRNREEDNRNNLNDIVLEEDKQKVEYKEIAYKE